MTPSQRRHILGHWTAPPPELLHWCGDLPSHRFLLNPAGSQPYLYLTRLVHQACLQAWGEQPISVLDWGCGKGQVSFLLKRLGLEVTSADVAEGEPVRPILEGCGQPWTALEHEWRLPYAEESFHAVVSFGVLEHVPDDQQSLREIQRVLKPGGLFFCFNLPQSTSWIMRLAHLRGNFYHDRLYTRKSVNGLLQAAGLSMTDSWRRQLFPKNTVRYPWPWLWERLDQWLCEATPLGLLATSLEFIAIRA